ncbi:MAG: hypothetical protein NT069_10795 [Planctomycetota bacterium]|nr:hypothetical protein [Planctomycetota bacterium]
MRASSSRWLLCGVLVCCGLLPGAIKRPIRRPTFDPSVPAVDLFEARERGLVTTQVIAKNAQEANLFVTNSTDQPVSVEIPPTVVAVQILKQIGAGGNLNGGNGGLNASGSGGGGQPVGGGLGNGSSGNNGGGGGNNQNPFGNGGNGANRGAGFFTIPPERTIQLPLQTVCLAHGRPDPTPRMQYQLVSAEEFTEDGRVRKILGEVARPGVDPKAAQAAAWHLTDDLSWETLAAKKITHLAGIPSEPYFTSRQLAEARRLVESASK